MLATPGSKHFGNPVWSHFHWGAPCSGTLMLVLSLYSPHASLVSSLSIQSCLFSVCWRPPPSSITSFQLAVLTNTIHLLPSSCLPLHPLPFLYYSVTSSQFAISTGSFICPSLSLLKQFTLGYLQMHTLVCAVMCRRWENDWLSTWTSRLRDTINRNVRIVYHLAFAEVPSSLQRVGFICLAISSYDSDLLTGLRELMNWKWPQPKGCYCKTWWQEWQDLLNCNLKKFSTITKFNTQNN